MINLPDEFCSRMKNMLRDEYDEFYNSYFKDSFKGLSVNTLKCSVQKLKKLIGFDLIKTNFSDKSFYIPDNISSLGNSPLHHAGAFYIQEPSASCAVAALDLKRYNKVLDLCAAPGGKSMQIANMLGSDGFLWSNEIVKKRANILLSNCERMGIRNSVVSSLNPEVLCSKLSNFFDRVLVDAPCSGEGMFRKNEDAISEWSYENVLRCAKRQFLILNFAAKAVKTEGVLVYSTCTFSKEENENVVEKFLTLNKNFKLEKIEKKFGREAFDAGNLGLDNARRVFPMDGGEGHFVAKLRKIDGDTENKSRMNLDNFTKAGKEAFDFYGEVFKDRIPTESIVEVNNNLLIIPNNMPDISGINIIRAGVKLGEIKKSRIEASHSVFMASKPENVRNLLNLSLKSDEIKKFLRGEEIQVPKDFSGYTGVAVESIMVGFGKSSNCILKNKYPKGLRNKN